MPQEETDDEKARRLVEEFGRYDPTLELASYRFPGLDLLNKTDPVLSITAAELDQAKQQIVETLYYAHIEIAAIKATIGPRCVLYEIVPGPGVRITQVVNREADIALRLGRSAKVIGAIPGSGTIGIEVPHERPQLVPISSLLMTETFRNTSLELPVILGRKMDNEALILDLVKLPHLLIAGATGQGKSVAIQAILTGLLYKNHPSSLKLVLIDLHKLELDPYWRIERHFLAKLPAAHKAVVTELKEAIHTLAAIELELTQRLELLRDAGVRNVQEYNEKFIRRQIKNQERHRYLPYMVLVIDDFADLVVAGNSVETSITRLTQQGRQAGIHLIISTQRPTAKILTGIIKSNFTCRIAFKTAASIDSYTIIDQGGAEKLTGNGDMLFYTGNQVTRAQGAFISTEEIENLGDFISNQRGYSIAMLLPEYVFPDDDSADFELDHLDPCFDEAAHLVVLHQQGSTSLIQRKLKLGYNRSGRIISQLEAAGILGPFDGSKAREVRFADEYSLTLHLQYLRTGKSLD